MTPFESSGIMSTSSLPIDTKKRLRFSDTVRVRIVPRIGVPFDPSSDYIDADVDSEILGDMNELWYSVKEISGFKRRDRCLVRLMDEQIGVSVRQQDNDGLHQCTRGLESRTREASYRRHYNREAAQRAVLEEQAFHYCPSNEYNDDGGASSKAIAIAETYELWSRQSQRAAHRMGLNDEQYVQELIAAETRIMEAKQKLINHFCCPSSIKATTAKAPNSGYLSIRRMAGLAA